MRTCNAESKKSSAKVPILKKTTGLCPSIVVITLWWNGSKLLMDMDHSPTTYQIYNQSQNNKNNKNPNYNFVQDILSHYQVLYMYNVVQLVLRIFLEEANISVALSTVLRCCFVGKRVFTLK